MKANVTVNENGGSDNPQVLEGVFALCKCAFLEAYTRSKSNEIVIGLAASPMESLYELDVTWEDGRLLVLLVPLSQYGTNMLAIIYSNYV